MTWPKVPMRELCDITSSKRIHVADYVSRGVPFYRGKEITEKYKGNTTVSTELFISEEQFSEIERKFGVPQCGDLLLTSVGTLGSPYVVKSGERFYFKDGNLTWFRDFKGLLSQLLYYWLVSPQGKAELQKCTIGSSQSAFTIVLLKGMEIELPPLPTQKKIAAILSAYDDLIENNEKRIKLLEDMAQNLYREWFVKFRFPNHEKVKMVDSVLGKIPQGWKPTQLDQLIDFNPSLSLKTDADIPCVAMEGLSTSSMIVSITESRSKTGGARFQNKDTLFARITPCLENGKTGFVQCLPSDDIVALGSTEFIVMRSRLLSPEYVYLLARSDNLRGLAIKSMSGATGRQRVQIQSVTQCELPKPDPEILKTFTSIVAPIFQEVWVLAKRNANLRSTRDLLLPKLISGEVDVSEMNIQAG